MAARETTNDRLFDAIERAKQEVHKSREVLRMNLTSTSPGGTSSGVSPQPAPSASLYQEAQKSYSAGMGLPVVPPELPGYAAATADTSTVSASVLPASLTVPAATPAPAAAAPPAPASNYSYTALAAAAALSAVPSLGEAQPSSRAASAEPLLRSTSAMSSASAGGGCLPPRFSDKTGAAAAAAPAAPQAPPAAPLATAAPAESFPAGGGPRQGTSVSQELERLLSQSRERAAAAGGSSSVGGAGAGTGYAPSPNTPSPPRAAPMQYTKYGSDAALPSTSAAHDAAPSYTTAAATAAANAAAAAPPADSAAFRTTAPSLPAPPAAYAVETPVPRPVAVPCTAPSALPAPVPAVGAAAAAASSADSPSAAVRAASPQRSEPPLSPPLTQQQQQDDLVMSPSVSLSPPRMGGAVMRALNSPPPAGAGLGGADAEAAAAQHAADQAELRRLRETLAQRDDDVARRDEEIGFLKAKNEQLQTRAAEQEAAAAASAVHEARAAQLEKEVEEVRQELSQRRQEFAQQKAALLLRYGLDQPQDDAASVSAETEAAAPVPAAAAAAAVPAATTVLPPPPARSASACSAVSAEPAAASAPAHRAVPRPDRSRTPERSAPLQQPAWNGSSGPPPRSASANTVESNAITVVGGDEHRRTGTPAARKPAVPRRGDRPAGHSPDPARSSAARARSRTPERAVPPPSTAPKPTTPRAGFAKRKVRDPSAVAADELLSEPSPAELVRLGAATDPPEDAAGWKQLLAQRRRTVHATHPCLASGAAAAEVDASGDAGISPCAAGGAAERKEIATGLWMLTAATLRGGTQLSFYNALPDTQFNLRYTFGEGSRMVPAHQDTVERAPGDFSVSVFPGETKPFVEGNSTSSKMSLSYGPVEVLTKQPRPLQAETRAEVAAVKQVLMHAADAKRVGGADLEALCAKAGARFVDLTFPPLPSSVARLWDAGCDALQNDVWAWRRMKLTPPPSAPETLAAQDVAGGSLSGVGTVEALSLAAAVCPATLRESICHTTADSCRVLLNRNGWWQTVTVDNHFPVNVSGEPMYAHCSTSSEQRWPSAVEKALAKLAGCYAALHAQDTASVFSAVTGAVASRTALAPTDDALVWECCTAASADRPVILTARTDVMSGSGLGAGRAYAVVEARELPGGVRIVRIKPLSTGKWRGDWAPMSKTWTSELSVACGADPSDGTQWISTADAARVFASSTELDLRWADATSVSVAGYFEAGVPDTLMQITYDGAAADVLVSLHQRTPAGHPSVDPDAHHAGLAAAMLHQRSKDNSYSILGMTNGGAYVADKRVAAVMPLRRGASFLVPQAFHAVDKAFVLCMRVHDHSKLSIKFVQRQKAGAASGRSFPLTITGLTAKSVLGVQGSRPYQTARRAAVANGAGSAVRWPRAAGGGPGPAEELCAALVRRAVPRAPAVRTEGCTPLEVVVVAGKGLHATAQPSCYCEVKLVQLNDAGEWLSLSGTLRRTRYVPETAAPTWGESIRFGQVAQSDYVFLKCFDKDLFSQEEMGEILLSLSEFLLTLTPGGPPSINWYPLQGQGATGTIQLSISIPAS